MQRRVTEVDRHVLRGQRERQVEAEERPISGTSASTTAANAAAAAAVTIGGQDGGVGGVKGRVVLQDAGVTAPRGSVAVAVGCEVSLRNVRKVAWPGKDELRER